MADNISGSPRPEDMANSPAISAESTPVTPPTINAEVVEERPATTEEPPTGPTSAAPDPRERYEQARPHSAYSSAQYPPHEPHASSQGSYQETPHATPYGANPYQGAAPSGANPYQGATPWAPGGKSKIAAGLLGIFLGTFGIHNFYLGRMGLGLIQLLLTVLSLGLLAWVSTIWGVIEAILILTSKPGSPWHMDAQGGELID